MTCTSASRARRSVECARSRSSHGGANCSLLDKHTPGTDSRTAPVCFRNIHASDVQREPASTAYRFKVSGQGVFSAGVERERAPQARRRASRGARAVASGTSGTKSRRHDRARAPFRLPSQARDGCCHAWRASVALPLADESNETPVPEVAYRVFGNGPGLSSLSKQAVFFDRPDIGREGASNNPRTDHDSTEISANRPAVKAD